MRVDKFPNKFSTQTHTYKAYLHIKQYSFNRAQIILTFHIHNRKIYFTYTDWWFVESKKGGIIYFFQTKPTK